MSEFIFESNKFIPSKIVQLEDNNPFTFKKRQGKIDWEVINDTNISEVIQQSKFSELQKFVSNFT
jgi:hypothetical protein